MASATGKPDQPTLLRDQSVFVEQVISAARARLVPIPNDAPLQEAARLLRGGTNIVIVCEAGGAMVGVLSPRALSWPASAGARSRCCAIM
ncbi:MAG: hypothetical protein ABIZ09_13095 [Rhodoferax sp.]|jgi:hypothetical protein